MVPAVPDGGAGVPAPRKFRPDLWVTTGWLAASGHEVPSQSQTVKATP